MDEYQGTEIRQFLDTIKIIDTHEHFSPEAQLNKKYLDFFSLLRPYICDDLITSGLSVHEWNVIMDTTRDLKARWEIFYPYLNKVRYTTYFLSLIKTLRLRFGVETVDFESAKHVTQRMQVDNVSGLYASEFERLNLSKALNMLPDYQLNPDYSSPVLTHVPTISEICPKAKEDIQKLSQYTGVDIVSVNSLNHALDVLCHQYMNAGIRSLKIGSAYHRNLDFKLNSKDGAARVLAALLSNKIAAKRNTNQIEKQVADFDLLLDLDDYIITYMLKAARENGWNVFIHTGMHAWNYNHVSRARAKYLQTLIEAFSDVHIALLHGGIPYIDDALLLTKYFPNVHINLTWTHIIDRIKSRELVARVLEMIPVHKVCAFGGDYNFVFNLAGHLEIAKENISYVLNNRIRERTMDIKDAKYIAGQWLTGNAENYFNE